MNLLDGADQPDVNALREELLNKWKDKPLEEVLKAKIESDLHIKTLEKEKTEMYGMYKSVYEENQAKAKLEELIDRLKPQDNQVAAPQANEVKEPQFDLTKIDSLLSDKIAQHERQKVEVENFNKVQSKLQERFGDNFQNVLRDQQRNLGLSVDDVNNLAKKSPEAFFRMLGLNEQAKPSHQAPPYSSQRNDSFSPKTVKRDYNYYQELKKTNPMLYLDPKIAVQMEKDAQELGASFGLPD